MLKYHPICARHFIRNEPCSEGEIALVENFHTLGKGNLDIG
jgi:hypothetical protein